MGLATNWWITAARMDMVLTPSLLLTAPVALLLWSKLEHTPHNGTLAPQRLMRTYLFAASASLVSLFASLGGYRAMAVAWGAFWRCAAARSLWTWKDLGSDLKHWPGWLHTCAHRWRILATATAVLGAALRAYSLTMLPLPVAYLLDARFSPFLPIAPAPVLMWLARPELPRPLQPATWFAVLAAISWLAYWLAWFVPYRSSTPYYLPQTQRLRQFANSFSDMSAMKLSWKVPRPSSYLHNRLNAMPPSERKDLLSSTYDMLSLMVLPKVNWLLISKVEEVSEIKSTLNGPRLGYREPKGLSERYPGPLFDYADYAMEQNLNDETVLRVQDHILREGWSWNDRYDEQMMDARESFLVVAGKLPTEAWWEPEWSYLGLAGRLVMPEASGAQNNGFSGPSMQKPPGGCGSFPMGEFLRRRDQALENLNARRVTVGKTPLSEEDFLMQRMRKWERRAAEGLVQEWQETNTTSDGSLGWTENEEGGPSTATQKLTPRGVTDYRIDPETGALQEID
ncbi:unnamed protein product [Chrysoparadoxa australica]